MLANGEDSEIVQELLGHSDVSMTLNRYSQVKGDMQRGAADRLDYLMSGTGTGTGTSWEGLGEQTRERLKACSLSL
jgi:hypothetical protein